MCVAQLTKSILVNRSNSVCVEKNLRCYFLAISKKNFRHIQMRELSTMLLQAYRVFYVKLLFNNSNGRMIKAVPFWSSALGIDSEPGQMTEKFVLTAYLIEVQYQRDSAENKPASLLAVSLGKAPEFPVLKR